ncbi:MAG: hypothetical protein AAFY20_00885 [Cyanobacteria bacterium J06639_14]
MDIRWQTYDARGNAIYITEERWEHIIDPDNHPEMEDLEENLIEVIRTGQRQQNPFNPQKSFYRKSFDGLSDRNNQIEAVVLFRFKSDGDKIVPNNYIVTAYPKR